MAMATTSVPPRIRKRILGYIEDESDRKATFKKRKKSLVKKARELSVLCGVTVCAVVCSPFRGIGTEVFPDVDGVREAFARFKGMTEAEQTRKKYSQERITAERVEKLKSKVLKVATGNREKEMTEVMFQFLGGQQQMSTAAMDLVDLNDLALVTQKHLQQITNKLAALSTEEAADDAPSPAAAASMNIMSAAPPPPPLASFMAAAGMQNYGDMLTPLLPDSYLNNVVSNGMWLPNVTTNNRPEGPAC